MSREAAPDPPKPAGAPRTVPCPTCGKQTPFEPGNRWRPFCSERCRRVDLGAWASESYRVPGKPADDDSTTEDGGSDA